MEWFYEIERQRQGPVDQLEFDRLVSAGTIAPTTLVWRQGMSDWQPYSTIVQIGPDSEICAASGKVYPKREMIQFEGKWISAEHRDLYFQRLREGVSTPGAFHYGGFWIRFCAVFLDGIILAIPSAIINMGLGAVFLGTINYFTGPSRARTAARVEYQVISGLVGLVLALAYDIYFIQKYSASPGKMAVSLKLIRSDGTPLSTGRIIGRRFAQYLSLLTAWIGYIMAGFDQEKRALHDRICDTRVIYSK